MWVERGVVGAVMAIVSAFGGGVASAQEQSLNVELNKLEAADGQCWAHFLIHNELGATLDRFRLDIVTFDIDGVIDQRFAVDSAPLYADKRTLMTFPLSGGDCRSVSAMLINDVPLCRVEETGQTLDCVAALSVTSRAMVPLEK